MKTAVICAFLVLALACTCNAQSNTAKCNPDANGMPGCTGDVLSSDTFRNNWDPTHFWVCKNGEATQEACPTAELYDPQSKTCVSWTVWQWENPCPPAST